MIYRVCKVFEVESGHMLSKHHDRCRFPHGHSRRIEVVLSSDRLDENDMVCDFQAIKLALEELLDRLDHAMAVNSADPARGQLEALGHRLVIFEETDPTTEALARHIYEYLRAQIAQGRTFPGRGGHVYALPPHVRVERVRVGETSSSWAEYARSPTSATGDSQS